MTPEERKAFVDWTMMALSAGRAGLSYEQFLTVMEVSIKLVEKNDISD